MDRKPAMETSHHGELRQKKVSPIELQISYFS